MHSSTSTAPLVTRPPVSIIDADPSVADFKWVGGDSDAAFAPFVDEATAEAVSVGLDANLLAVDGSNVVGTLPVQFRRRVTVGDTATLFGTDDSQSITVVATVTKKPPALKLNLRYLAGGPALPRELLPAFRFLRALRRPNRFGMTIGERPIGEPEELPIGNEFPQSLVEVVRSLAFVQKMTGVEFPMPPEFHAGDLRALREAEALLRGEKVSNRWVEAKLGLDRIDSALLEVVHGDAPVLLELTAPALVDIAGNEVLLGDARYVFLVAILENYEELVHAADAGDVSNAEARLRPGDNNGYEVTLLAPPEIGFDDQDVRPPVLVLDGVLEAARLRPLRRRAFEPNPA